MKTSRNMSATLSASRSTTSFDDDSSIKESTLDLTRINHHHCRQPRILYIRIPSLRRPVIVIKLQTEPELTRTIPNAHAKRHHDAPVQPRILPARPARSPALSQLSRPLFQPRPTGKDTDGSYPPQLRFPTIIDLARDVRSRLQPRPRS